MDSSDGNIVEFKDIYNLGLIYEVDIKDGLANVIMTLTSINCPNGKHIATLVDYVMRSLPGVKKSNIKVTFDLNWDRSRLSRAARIAIKTNPPQCDF